MQKLGIGCIVLLVFAIVMVSSVGAETAHVVGQKFYDYNQNGIYDSDDFPLQDWTIRLYWLNGTAVPGKETITGTDGTYNISNIDPYFSYNVTEIVQPGWNPTTPSTYTVYFVTCGGGQFEFFTDVSNMVAFMTNQNDAVSQIYYGYNARIGNAVTGTGNAEELKISYPNGQWNAGQSSVGISPDGEYVWQNNTYVPFNATFIPGGAGTATFSVNGITIANNSVPWTPSNPGFPNRPNAIPVRDIVIRLHSENPQFTVEINNVTLKQGSYTYHVFNSPLNMTSNAIQDKYFVLLASDILISEGGQDIATGGFNLTGDIRFIWPPDEPGNPVPQNNEIKMDVYVGRYNCFPVTGAIRDFGNYITGNISGYKTDETGNGLAGWNITLTNESLAYYAYNLTNASGYYSLANVPFGGYWLNETISDWSFWVPVTGNRSIEINQTNLILTNQNFTNRQLNGSVSGYKFNETGTGLPGWTIQLYNATSGNLVNSTNTGAGGYYVFENINEWGQYNITEVQQTGWQLTSPANGWYSGITINGIPVTDQYNFTNELKTGYISGYKRNASDNNAGIAGWTIYLYNETGNVMYGSMMTSSGGFYNFTGLPFGISFNVSEELRTGYKAIAPTFFAGLVINDTTPYHEERNFTNELETYCINGYKYEGPSGTAGIEDWTIVVYNSTAVIGTTDTNATGYYEVCGLLPGEYMVCEEDRAGWVNLTDLCQNVTIGFTNVTAEPFRNEVETYCINGTKIDNCTKEGISGWTVRVRNVTGYECGNDTTDSNGDYEICGLLPGDYTVCEDLVTGWMNVTPLCQDVTIGSANVTVNFTNMKLLCISGYKLDDCTNAGLPGWTITLTNGTYTVNKSTDDSGFYQFCDLLPGQYNVTENLKEGYAPSTTPELSLNLLCNNNLTNQNFTNTKLLCISGYKLDDWTKEGIPGWMITLTNGTYTVNQSTDGSGKYEFCGLLPGIYTVNETLNDGWSPVTAPSLNVSLTCNTNLTNQNFTNQQIQPLGYISGYKIQAETGLGVPNWTIEVYNQTGSVFVNSAITNGSGFYNITGLPYGVIYNVSEVVEPGWTPVSPVFVPNLTINEQTPYYQNVNFTNDPPVGPQVGNITGRKGDQKCPTCGLPGWDITLYYASNDSVYATYTTGPDGTYEFLNVPYGTYRLNETLILGWKQITPNTTITLNATNPDAIYNFINAEDETCCVCPPTASFTYEKSGQKVQFTDTSTGPHAVRWIWFFGDGTISTLQNPEKTYSKPGSYMVRLYITWADCDGVTYQWKSASQRIRVP